MAKAANKRRRDFVINVGDEVYVLRSMMPPSFHKAGYRNLRDLRVNPYRVVAVPTANLVKIVVPDHGKRVIHVEGVMRKATSQFGKRDTPAREHANVSDDEEVGSMKQYFRMSLCKQQAAWNEVQRLLKLGWIRASNSDWASPLLFAKNKKKDGLLRAVYNYRTVNACTIPHQGPIPRVSEMIYNVAQGKWKTLLDVSGAFNQLRVRDSKERITAFYTPWNLFESLVMPMGMRNAGPWMQAFMVAMFEGNPDALPQRDNLPHVGRNGCNL